MRERCDGLMDERALRWFLQIERLDEHSMARAREWMITAWLEVREWMITAWLEVREWMSTVWLEVKD